MPSRRRPDPEPTLSIFPEQIHIGDRFTDTELGDEAHEWEVVSRPVTFKKGHEVRARVQRPGNPATAREKYWAAHEKITVRRVTASPSRPTAEPDAIDDVDALRRELRRLRGEVVRLEEDKGELEKRIASLQRGAWVEYQPADDVPEGHAHFEIFELPKGRTAALADALAEIVQPPGPIKPPDNPVRGDATQ